MIIPPQPCRYCGELFTPAPRAHQRVPKFCRVLCSRRWHGEQRRGQAPTAALAARKRKDEARLTSIVAAEFGPLSAREQALARTMYRVGYGRGYNAGYNLLPAGNK